jgi:histidinol-phosphate/aromatic aminotransferase/cobyric acid decarboxylase-like protein/imidazoleglycerol phosphate dehydratase HisB
VSGSAGGDPVGAAGGGEAIGDGVVGSGATGGEAIRGGMTPPGAASAPRAVPLPNGFASYTWASTPADVAARHGLRVEQVLKFDQNTPPLPGVPQIPLAESFARLNEYPDGRYRELREAAAAYVGASTTWEQVVVGAGADDLILLCARTFLGPSLRAAIAPPTYALYRIATQLAGAQPVDELDGAALIWRCNPNNPTGETTPAADLAALARSHPDAVVVVDEAYVEFGAESVVPYLAETPNLIVVRTLSKAFGFAALRVGYAVAAPQTAALLEERRAPAPIAAPAARIAAAALGNPRFDVESTLAERERVRASLAAAGWDAPVAAGNFVWLPTKEPLGARLEAEGLIVRRFPQGIRITLRRPTENDVLLRALGAEPGPAPGRSATVIRTTTETALRITLDLDGSGRSRVETGIGFLDHLLTLMSFHAGLDLDCVAGGDLDVDEHHTVEDVLASLGSAVAQALGAREGVARYGSAVVPMDEARAIAAVDLVRRPHAEIELAFTGDRVGGLALSLLPHALERFTMEAGCTVHVEASGKDDHHVAEAAFKALGQALRQAVAPGGEGIRSTKGAA